MTESGDQFLPNIWESNGRLDHVTIESCDLDHEGIGDDSDGLLDYWTIGLLDYWTNGLCPIQFQILLDYWTYT